MTGAKKLTRTLQKFLEERLLSNSLEKFIWRTKHLYRPQWAKISLNTHELEHRKGLVSIISTFDDIDSVFELGCAAGPNLRLLRSKLPQANLSGSDINHHCVATGNKFFTSNGDLKSHLYHKSSDQLDFIEDKTIDVSFTQGCLLLLPPSKISSTLEELFRISRKGLVLHEYHNGDAVKGYFDEGRWVYNYVRLIQDICPHAKTEIFASSFRGGSWDTYGKIIKITLQPDRED